MVSMKYQAEKGLKCVATQTEVVSIESYTFKAEKRLHLLSYTELENLDT